MELGCYSNSVIVTGLIRDSSWSLVGFKVRFKDSMEVPQTKEGGKQGSIRVNPGMSCVLSRFDFEMLMIQPEMNSRCRDVHGRYVVLDVHNVGESYKSFRVSTRFYVLDGGGKQRPLRDIETRTISDLDDNTKRYLMDSKRVRSKMLVSPAK